MAITIQKIQFFTPAMITWVRNGETHTHEVKVDCRNQEVLLQADMPPELADLFFPFLNESLNISANEFEADDNVYDNASKATEEFEKAHKDHVGGDNA